jgi:putative ABC transport system permease protein
VIRFAVLSLRRRRATALSCVIALVSATLGFAFVTTAATGAHATLSRDLQRTWDTPYDLLVRPPGSASELEVTLGLVRPNFLGGIHGGITEEQLAAIRAIPGVEIAAPVAPVGFVEWPSAYVAKLPASDDAHPTRLYRIRTVATGDAGLSEYPVEERYAISAIEGKFDIGARTMQVDGQSIACRASTNCFAGEVCREGECEAGGWPGLADTRYYLPLLQPISIAGIDPGAEDAMSGLANCITSGRLLASTDDVVERHEDEEVFTTIPVLLADRTFVDQRLTITVDEAMGSPDLSSPAQTRQWSPLSSTTTSINELYRAFLPSLADYQDPWPIWGAGDVQYGVAGERHVSARAAAHEDLFSMTPLTTEFDVPNAVVVPPEEHDTSFRSVSAHRDQRRAVAGGGVNWRLWQVVGTYDPTCLPGFDPLAGGALETYAFPAVTLPDGTRLAPNRSMAGYINSPPLVLTSLEGAQWMSDPAHYVGQPGEAFIGAVRIVAEGSEAPTEAAYARLLQTAETISSETGLLVDIVKGGSPVPVNVDIPAGTFGRPALTASEGWTAKGVAVRLAGAVNAQDVAFAGVAAMILMLMVSVTFIVSVELRRSEHATLEALGWTRRSLTRAVQAESVVLGLASSLVSVAVVIIVGFVVGGVSTMTYAVAALAPAVLGVSVGLLSAGRRARADANADDDGSLAVRDFIRVPTPWRLASLELRRGQPALTALAGLGIAGGVALISLTMLVGVIFGGAIQISALDRQIAFTVGPFHWLLGALVLVTTVATLSQVSGLAHRRRRRRLAMLRAVGWPRGYVLRVELLAAVILGLGSSVLPCTLIVALAAALGQPVAGLAVGLCGLCIGALIAIAGAVPSLRSALSLNVSETLRPTA